MGAPETGTEVTVVGSWKTLQIGVPEVFQTIAEQINSIAEALITILNVALAILNVIKAFLVGFLDPLSALIEVIINEIEALLQDIRQIGLYVSGDWPIRPDFDNVIGGYSAYQRRMIGRLVDRTDVTRPDFSEKSAVIAIFLYSSADITQIAILLQVLKKIMDFFGIRGRLTSFTQPVGLEATYGLDGAGLHTFQTISSAVLADTTPDVVNVRWRMAPATSASGVAWPQPPPSGFLIEVSTVRDGLLIGYDAVKPNSQADENGQQSRARGLIRDTEGNPFRLYGGPDQLSTRLALWREGRSGGKWRPGGTMVYAFRDATDNTPIPIPLLKDGDIYFMQRTFFVATSFETQVPGQGFSASLAYEDMPWVPEFTTDSDGVVTAVSKAEDAPATTVYMRIVAVTADITSETAWHWNLDQTDLDYALALGEDPRLLPHGNEDITLADRGPLSAPLTVTFPNTQTQAYLETVAAALAVMLLSRSDLIVPGDVSVFQGGVGGQATGLEEPAKALFKMLVGTPGRFFRKSGNPARDRRMFLRRCRATSNDLYAKSGPMGSLEEYVVDQGAVLLTFKWSEGGGSVEADGTILETLESRDEEAGVGRNPLSVGWPKDYAAQQLEDGYWQDDLTRSPGFLEDINASSAAFIMGDGSCDFAPVVYSRNGAEMQFCRNLFTEEVYTAAATVLNIVGAPWTLAKTEGRWIVYRLFPQGLPGIEQAMDQIIAWLRSIQAGVSSIVDQIIAYIEFVEARILELQALINRINALLQRLLSFSMPQVNGLIVTGEGTNGIVTGLVAAEDQPNDESTAYGAGAVILAGGLPTAVVEILELFFPTAE